ncbi:DUF4012 domain-containing protein [Nocardioides sp. CN2-186]|uniref:DUF4012 domain-containing protein n=1 Tax=Nocardioides tweenelious TaxID=3156607 RepID=UPI0032B4F904
MRRRRVWTAVWVLLGFVLVAAAWAGWQVFQVNRDLNAAVDDASALRTAVVDGNDQQTDAALASLKQHSSAAASRADGHTWSLLTHLPVFGDDARGVQVVSDVAADLSRDGVEPLIQTSDDLDGVVPSAGRLDVPALVALQGPVAQGRAAFEKAQTQLDAEDPSGYVERLRSKYRELAGQVADAADLLSSAQTALRVMPAMLGEDSAQNYLLVFQNNAEIRATGGLPGAVSLVSADHGKVEMTRQVAANTFGKTAKPVLPLSVAERKTYGTILGTYFLDANLQPDFARAADLWKTRWEQVYPGDIDGVLSIDPVAISYLLGATGSVQVGDMTLTADNAVDELLHQVYLRYPAPAAQDRYFRAVARAVFDKVSQGVESPQDLVSALTRGVREHRIYAHSFDPQVQDTIATTAVAGDLVTDPNADPQVGVYVNDGTAAKMSYYLRYDVNVSSTYCTNGVQGLAGDATFVSDAPPDAASLPRYVTGGGVFGPKPGSQFVIAYLYGPVGGSISGLMINGRPIPSAAVVDRGRQLTTVSLLLKPQQKVHVTWRMKTGSGQTGPTTVSVTPSIEAGQSSSQVASACG